MQIVETKTIYQDGEYVSFPNLALLKDGTILCAFRHAPDRIKEFGACIHLDPEAKDVFVRSFDGGKTFEPEYHTILDEEMISNQDPCITVLSDGRILSTSYRWLFAPIGEGANVWGDNYRGTRFFDRYDACGGEANCSYSDDNGKTWNLVPSLPVPCAVRGNITEMPNGDLLMPYYGSRRPGELSSSGLFRSTNRGETWEDFSLIAAATPEKNFYEPNIFRTQSGRIIALIRTQTDTSIPGARYEDTYLNVHMTVSDDNGKTFGPVKEIKNFWVPIRFMRCS